MKNNLFIISAALFISCFLLAGCGKIETNYYADPENPDQAIFSNTGNNLMTCFFDNHQWKTIVRKTGSGFGAGATTELNIRRIKTSGTFDTLTITWKGDNYNPDQYDIAITLPVAKNFEWKDFAAYTGKRISIDSSNGYFSLYQSFNNFHPVISGRGVIYFNTANIESPDANVAHGRIAGLLEANFISSGGLTFTITNGRFDDNVTSFELGN